MRNVYLFKIICKLAQIQQELDDWNADVSKEENDKIIINTISIIIKKLGNYIAWLGD